MDSIPTSGNTCQGAQSPQGFRPPSSKAWTQMKCDPITQSLVELAGIQTTLLTAC